VVIRNGNSSSREGRGGRPILGLGRIETAPTNCVELPGVEQSEHSTHSPESQFETALWSERNRWDIARRRLPKDRDAWFAGGGLAGSRKLDRSDADRLWCAFLSTLAKEGAR
jgi:hypothetical protein